MADKLKAGVSVRSRFVDGESLRGAKLDTLPAQLQRASERLEQAIGDIWSESYPYSTLTDSQLSQAYGKEVDSDATLVGAGSRSLDIVSLGRIIGPASNLNPHLLGVSSITEAIPSSGHEYALTFLPTADAPSFSDTVVFNNQVIDVADLNGAGDYYIDTYGRVYTVTSMNGGTVTYDTNPVDYNGGNAYQSASFNCIPDLNQLEAGNGCAISAIDGSGRRTVVLPLATHHHYNTDGSSVVLGVEDPLYNYQLTLPKILSDNYSSEEAIPEGFLYLKNYTKNITYLKASYYYYSETAILIGDYDITSDVDDGDVFGIITVGTDITTSIDDLRRKLYHSHSREFGEPLVPVTSLSNILSAVPTSGVYLPSEIPGNIFPQYLHRDGWRSGSDNNLNENNILRGDLGIGISGASPGTYEGSIGESYRIRFLGPLNARPSIGKGSAGALILDASQGITSTKYATPQTKGVRIQNGILVPEGGIHSGLGTSEVSLKTIAFHEENISPAFFLYTIDLEAYGLDTVIHRILGVSCLIRNSGVGTEWFQPGTLGYEATVAVTDHLAPSPFALVVGPTGSAWLGGDADISGVLFFYERYF